MKSTALAIVLWIAGITTIALTIAVAAASFVVVLPLMVGIGIYLSVKVNQLKEL